MSSVRLTSMVQKRHKVNPVLRRTSRELPAGNNQANIFSVRLENRERDRHEANLVLRRASPNKDRIRQP